MKLSDQCKTVRKEVERGKQEAFGLNFGDAPIKNEGELVDAIEEGLAIVKGDIKPNSTDYCAVEFKPGLTPLEYKVIVYPYPVDEKFEDSVIVKAVVTEKTDRMSQTRGVLVDFTDMAFENWKCKLPKRGQEVEFSKLSGQFFDGMDGKEYKLMNDQDLVGFFGENK